jgi:hypothetical protein
MMEEGQDIDDFNVDPSNDLDYPLEDEDIEQEALLAEAMGAPMLNWEEVQPEPLNRSAEERRQVENVLPPFDAETIPGPTQPANDGRLRDIYVTFLFRIIPVFVRETNNYARSMGRVNWTDITIPDFYKFLAILLYMGISPKPQRRMYWSNTKFRDPFVASVMSRDRFETILDNLHCVNTAALNEEELRMQLADNVWFSVQPFIDELNTSFAEL